MSLSIIPAGKGKTDYNDLSISKSGYLNLMKSLLEDDITTEKVGLIDVEEPYSYVKELEIQKTRNIEKISYRSCLQGELICALSPEGNILPCPIGNFKEFEVKYIGR